MKTYTLPYGSGSVSFRLDEAQVLAELHGNRVEALGDIRGALRRSLEEPIGSAPLRERVKHGDKVALVVSDMSRFWMRQDLVVPHLVDYLNDACGVPDEDITIVIANGTHLGGSEEDLRKLVTDAVYERVAVVNHDCMADDLVELGVTPHGTPVQINRIAAEADLVLCLGACTHHVMAGFGGGRKSILPGISSLESIRHNHAFALDPNALRTNPLVGNAVLKGNPLHEDMCEAAGMVPNLFIVNLVMNAEMKLAAVFSGHCIASWERACEEVNRIYRVPVPRRAEVVIASCGGYPKDMSLYQGTKSIDNVETGLKPGGTLILSIEAREGGGPAEYFDWSKDLVAGTIEQRLRNEFTIPGYIFFLTCEQAQRYRIFLYSSVDPALVAPMGIRAYSDMDALLRDAQIDGKETYIIPNGATVIPYVDEKE